MNNYSNNARSMNGLNNINASGGTFDDITTNTLTVNSSAKAPTVSALSNDTNVATTAWVTSHAGGTYVTTNTTQTLTTGIKTFTNLPECSTSASTGNQLTNKTFTDATYVALTGAQTIGGIKTFTSLPQSSAVPVLGDELINKSFGDANYVSGAGFVTTNTTQNITGAKTFTTNTLKAEAGVTIKNGASAQTATLTQNATTLDVIGAGDISINPTNDFNVVTGTGKDINISCPSTALLPSTQTFATGITNTSSYIALESPTIYITGLSTQPNLIISGGFGTIYGLKFTRGGTALAAINRINCSSTNDTLYLEVNSGTQLTVTNSTVSIAAAASITGATTIVGTTNINTTGTSATNIGNATGDIDIIGDTTLNQTTYPSTNTLQIGYTITKTFATTVLSDTTGTYSMVGSGQALGTVKGVYLITCGFELTNSGSDTMNNKAVVLSLTTASGTPVNAFGAWEYYDEINDSMGAGGTRFIGTLSGVYIKTTTSAQSLFLNGYSNTSGSVTISCTGNCSITRIG